MGSSHKSISGRERQGHTHTGPPCLCLCLWMGGYPQFHEADSARRSGVCFKDSNVLNAVGREWEASVSNLSEKPCFEKVVACLGVKALIWLSLLMYGMASKDTHNKRQGEWKF